MASFLLPEYTIPMTTLPGVKAAAAPAPGKIFGRDVIAPEGLTAVSKDVNQLLGENTPLSVFAAARELTQLKRLRVNVSPRQRDSVFAKLLAQRTVYKDPATKAQYLSYLQYLGALEGMDGKEEGDLEYDVIDFTTHIEEGEDDGGATAELFNTFSRLIYYAKNLGVDIHADTISPYVTEDINRLIEDKDQASAIIHLARAQYCGITSEELQIVKQRVEAGASGLVADFQEQGAWGKVAAVQAATLYLRGGGVVPAKEQEQLSKHADKLRGEERWRSWLAYVSLLSGLSRQPVSANTPAPELPIAA
jgi:hypothetical protein